MQWWALAIKLYQKDVRSMSEWDILPEGKHYITYSKLKRGGSSISGDIQILIHVKYICAAVQVSRSAFSIDINISINRLSPPPVNSVVREIDVALGKCAACCALCLHCAVLRDFISFLILILRIMRRVMGNKSSCPTQGDKVVELIYIDIVGLTQFKKTLGPSWVHYQ